MTDYPNRDGHMMQSITHIANVRQWEVEVEL